MLLMDFSISSKWNVSASRATFFEMLNAWSASFFPDMTRISRGLNQRACKDCVVAFVTHFQPQTGLVQRVHPRPDRGRIARDTTEMLMTSPLVTFAGLRAHGGRRA